MWNYEAKANISKDFNIDLLCNQDLSISLKNDKHLYIAVSQMCYFYNYLGNDFTGYCTHNVFD
jgi:hypothetical protein